MKQVKKLTRAKLKIIYVKNFNQEIKELASIFSKPPIFDGIVNEDEYKNSYVKIMWILKDPNSTGEYESYDLRDAINNLKKEYGIRKGWEMTFSNIIYVTDGILNQTEWDDIPYPRNQPEIVDVLKQIAFANIKKVGGGSRSVESEIEDHFEKSNQLLISQIEEFNPDVVIFGNTYRFFRNHLDLNQMNIFGTCRATSKKNRIYIDAYHPSARINGEKYFKDILKAYSIFKKQIDNIEKISYPSKFYKKDVKALKKKVLDSKEQSIKIKANSVKSQQFEKIALYKPIIKKLEQVLNEIDKLDVK